MTALRVLHVVPSLAPGDGGPTRAVLEMEAGLAAAGVAVTTLATAARGEAPAGPGGEGVRRVLVRRWCAPYKPAPALAAVLPGLLRRHDVVHVHALFSCAPNAAALGARALGVPYVVRPLGTLGRYGLAARRPALKRLSLACLEGPLLRGAAAVHFTSAAERDEAAALALPLRAVVIPLAAPAGGEGPHPGPPHPALAGRPVVLFLSRLDPKKNLEGLIDALAGPGEGAPALLVAGDGPPDYVAGLRARAERAGLGGRVAWLGHVAGPAKAAAFAAADLFALPSFSENFGLAAAEALAAGLPCVLARDVALSGEVARAGAGVAVEPEPAALRAALAALLADPGRRAAMGRRARALAERYSRAAMTERLIALYEGVRAAGGGGR